MIRRHNIKRLKWHGMALLGALAAAAPFPVTAQAAGLFDFLFGGQDQRPSPPARVESYAEPSAPIRPAPLPQQSVQNGGAGTGHVVAYCVRLCDGQHFPLERMTNATQVETCRAMCPSAKTKVYFGSEIGASVAKDGARYADLDTAYIYRKQMVANCTCNGKDGLGLAPFEASTDPTLRPGDIVATKKGLMAYSGGASGSAGQFTPVQLSSVTTELNSVTKRMPHSPHVDPEADDDPGTIAMPQGPLPPVNVGANMRGAASR
ncbi:MAG TPA: DUF2865 domain-containing protein [Xanthobacteraceae bacterium]